MNRQNGAGWSKALGHPRILVIVLSILGLRLLDHFLGVLTPTMWRWLLACTLIVTAALLFLGRRTPPKELKSVRHYESIVIATCLILVGSAIAALAWPDPTKETVTVGTDINLDHIVNNGHPLGGTYVLPKPIADLSPPPNEENTCVGRYEWATGQGGVVAEHQTVRVTVRRATDVPIQITGFNPVVVDAKSPVLGSMVGCGGEGGNVPVRRIEVKLNKTKEASWEYAGSPQDDNKAFVFNVERDQPLVFDVDASAIDCDCAWVAEFRYKEGTEANERTIRVDNNGQPFRASAASNATRYQRIGGQWIEQNPIDNPIGGARLDACDLLPRAAVEQVVGTDITRGNRGEFVDEPGLGGNTLRTSKCNFSVGKPDNFGTSALVGAIFSIAPNAEIATAEARAFRTATGSPDGWTSLTTLGHEAFVRNADGAVQVRRGAETLSVFMSPTDLAQSKRAQILQLARAAVTTAWP